MQNSKLLKYYRLVCVEQQATAGRDVLRRFVKTIQRILERKWMLSDVFLSIEF